MCTRCSQLTVCSLYNEAARAELEAMEFPLEQDLDIYSASIRHLTDKHKKYFFKWIRMLEYEFNSEKQFEAGPTLWWDSHEKLETAGWTVFNLEIVNTSTEVTEDYEGEGFYPFKFKRINGIT
jgi:hypothetical protein